MKKFLNLLCVVLLLAITRCSDETIEPQELSEDLKTSAYAYRDQFFTIEITTNYDDDITFYLYGEGGEVYVDWGDRSGDSFILSEDYVTLSHDYNREEEDPGDYTIRVSGDITTITEINFFYDDFYVNHMHFGGLTNLRTLGMGVLANGPQEINLSRNRLIESVTLPGVGRLENLILPTTNKIRSINISGGTLLPVAVVNRIIARVHDSVVNSPRSGYFNLGTSWAQEEGDMTMVGPPASYSLNKLRKLRDRYGWTIFPDVP